MKKLLMLGASFVSMELVRDAKKRGWYTIVTDNQPLEESPVKQAADEAWLISTADVGLLEERCRAEGVNAVFAGVSEFNLDRVHEMTRNLGLPCYIDAGAWEYARNKRLFKDKCIEMGIPVVPEYPIPAPDDEDAWDRIVYPVVVKPVDGAGNAGLSICRNREELVAGLRKAREWGGGGKVLIERYIVGEETWNHYYLAGGQVRFVYAGRVFRQPGYPTFLYSFASTAAAGIDEYKQRMNSQCVELLKEIGCKEGLAWIQCIRDDKGDYYAMEMAHRMSAGTSGGLLARCCGCDSVEWMLDTALGVKHTADMLPQEIERPYAGAQCIYFLFADHSGRVGKVQGLDELDVDRFRVETTVRVGTPVNQYRMMAKIAFFARRAGEMCQMLQHLNQTIEISDEEGKSLVVRFTDYAVILRAHHGLMRES